MAGLTIHHVMESMAVQPRFGSGTVQPVAAAAYPFQFSSSTLTRGGEAMPHVRGSQHKRHPSMCQV
jgi:hypothetical protein